MSIPFIELRETTRVLLNPQTENVGSVMCIHESRSTLMKSIVSSLAFEGSINNEMYFTHSFKILIHTYVPIYSRASLH